MEPIPCAHCFKMFLPNPKQKNQRYCGDPRCQKARKAAWQRHKMATDPDYRANQRYCNQRWIESNPDYWRRYRKRRPEKAERNRLLQAVRNTRRPEVIAKMDVLKSCLSKPLGMFYLVPLIAKMDAIKVNIFQLSG